MKNGLAPLYLIIAILYFSFLILHSLFPCFFSEECGAGAARDAHVHRFADVMVALVEHHHLALFCAAA